MGLFASREAAPSVKTVRVHARLGGGDRPCSSFGLHVWGPAAASGTSWHEPLPPSGEDWFGPYFDVELAGQPAPEGASPALGLLLHRGDDKRGQLEVGASAVPPAGGALWFGHGPEPLFKQPEPTAIPAGDLGSLGARAHWLSTELIAWRAAAAAESGSKCLLHSSSSAALADAGAGGVRGGDAGPYELQPTKDELALEAMAQAHPYLRGCALLRVPPEADAKRLCRTQLAVSLQSATGETLDCTGVQVGVLLDELFAYTGPLGCCPEGEGVAFALWAPTAVNVGLNFYSEPRGAVLETLPMARSDDGVWRLSGPSSWWGRWYTYQVEAFHPLTGTIANMEVPDPYSHTCAADAGRSLAKHLGTWTKVVPGGDFEAWRRRPRPPFEGRAGAVVYELHVRDFSAMDTSVPQALRGKYLAFAEKGTNGDQHLRRLAEAGVTHVQLLPTYDFGSVPERKEDRTEQVVPTDAAPDSEAQQEAAVAVADRDSFNWGYDPVLYNVPEGSYATDPDGGNRVLEHRCMVAALHDKGLRVVLDVVYNHTLGGGPEGSNSVLDKCVPGYYHRRSESGQYESSTCMNNTAGERTMMERLIVDSLIHWAVEYRVDGFRFDLMGHIPLRCIKRCRAALDALTLEEHGVDGPNVLLHGEGWEFGEIAGGQRGVMAVQHQLAGTGVGSFNDRVRDAVLGGSPFTDPRTQGFATGLGLRSWPASAGVGQGTAEEQTWSLICLADKIRLSLMGSLRDYILAADCGARRDVPASEVHGGGLAYTLAPVEALNYVSAHDNETLYDNTVWKMPASLFSPEERMRANWLCTSLIALSHGVPFFHAGDEVLRSKSLDRDSYNSGDWFNLLDFTGERSVFGSGLPPRAKNAEKWDLMRPLLRDTSLRPTPEMARATTSKFCELLLVRKSTPLIGLASAADVHEKVDFPGCGAGQVPGVIVMQTRNGAPAASTSQGPLCGHFARVVIVFSARLEELRIPAPQSATESGLALRLHPLQAASEDPTTRAACLDATTGELVVPPQTASVFVEPLPGQESWDGLRI